jgi:CRISPR-associated protein Cmr3
MIIRINPLDTFFFKDGKPFSLGEETWADGVFPPSPSVIYGALRALYFSEKPDELKKANTPNDPTNNLKIKGIFLEIDEQIYLPVPADFVVHKENNRDKCLLKVIKPDNFFSSQTTEYIAVTDGMMEKIENNPLFQKIYYERYLDEKKIKKLPYKTSREYLQKEPKVGIGRNNITHTTEEGKLYRVDMQRFQTDKIRIIIDIDGLESNSGFMKLGGEGKSANYEIVNDEEYTKIKPPKIDGKYFKLCLSTPTIFENGWLPSWLDEKTFTGKFNSLKLKLLTAVIGKYTSIGGFDMKRRSPKPMYKVVPTGSVYYFEIQNGTQQDVIDTFHQQSISELNTANQGFGITYVGKTQIPLITKGV